MSRLRQKPIIHGRDHAPGGADPIPGLVLGGGGGGGGGIDFDVFPQIGGYLHIQAGSDNVPYLNESIHIESNSSMGLDPYQAEIVMQANVAGMLLYSRGRMTVMSEAAIPPLGDPRLGARLDLHSDLSVGSGAGMSADYVNFIAQGGRTSDAYPEFEVHMSSNDPATARGAMFRLYSYGEFAISLNQFSAPSSNTKFAIYATTNSGNAKGANPIFEVRRDGSIHIKSGTSIIADL